MSGDTASGIEFESVIFRAGLLEVSFTEPHHRSNGIINVQTLVWDPHHPATAEQYEVFILALVELIETTQVALRNPPEEIDGR